MSALLMLPSKLRTPPPPPPVENYYDVVTSQARGASINK